MFRKTRFSLATRIALMAGLTTLLAMVVVTIALLWLSEKTIQRNLDNHLLAFSDILVSAIQFDEGKIKLDQDNLLLQRLPRHWQVAQEQQPLFHSSSLQSWIPVDSTAKNLKRLDFTDLDGTQLVAVQSVFLFPQDISVIITFGLPKIIADAYQQQERETLRNPLLKLLALVGVVLLLITFGLVRIAIKPLQSITTILRTIHNGKAERIDGQWPTEIQTLTDEINDLIEHNNHLIERYRQFSANLAHSLKTPLTVLHNTTDRALVQEKVDQMHQIIERNLARVPVVGSGDGKRHTTEIKPVLTKIERNYQRLYQKTITIQCADDSIFRGHAQDLYEVLGNLIENACRHAKQNISVTCTDETIVIEDDGLGLAEADYSAVIQRGTRLNQTQPGSGIGLAIACDIVELYQGQLTFDKADLGGLRVILRLPRR